MCNFTYLIGHWGSCSVCCVLQGQERSLDSFDDQRIAHLRESIRAVNHAETSDRGKIYIYIYIF